MGSQVYDFIRDKEKIREHGAALLHGPSASKIFHKAKLPFPDVDTAVIKWYQQLRAEGVPVRGIER